jgi:hypothetical protein
MTKFALVADKPRQSRVILIMGLPLLKFSLPPVENLKVLFDFPEKTFPCGSFSGRPKQKKRKIGTIFCPKGGLGQIPKAPLAQSAVVNKNSDETHCGKK